MSDLDLLVAELFAGGGERLEVGGKNLGAGFWLVLCDQSVNVHRAEEELVETVVGGKKHLGGLVRAVGSHLVGDK